MKKYGICGMLTCVLFCLVMTGCGKKKAKEVQAPQEIWKNYGTQGSLYGYTLDTEGSLYTMEGKVYAEQTVDVSDPWGSGFDTELENWLRKYDADGNLLFSVFIGKYPVNSLTCIGDVVYFADAKEIDVTIADADGIKAVIPVLFAADAKDGTVREIAQLPSGVFPDRIVSVKEKLYLLSYEGDEYSPYAEKTGNVLEYVPETGTFTRLAIRDILDITATGEEHLLIYAKQEEYVFLLYDTEKSAVKILAKMTEKVAESIAAGTDEESVIYMSKGWENNVIYARFADMEHTAEIYPDALSGGIKKPVSAGGKLLLPVQKAFRDSVVVVDLSALQIEHREIRYLSSDDGLADPYGCGFTITRNELNSDKLVLKLLAQDTDFDMVYVNSWFSNVSNVRDSGCFYPLNDVPGVQEYLDRCFPYVREAVTDADGNIWMLPTEVDMELMICDTRRCAEKGYAFPDAVTYADFLAALGSMQEEDRRLIDNYAIAWGFMVSYFYDHKSVDTPEFREAIEMIRRIMPLISGMNISGDFRAKEYIYKIPSWTFTCDEEVGKQMYGEHGRMYALPKHSADAPNVATCRGFIVNPKSDNLEQTLQYVATYAAYQMNKKEIPAFFAIPQIRTDTYRGSIYRVYENGVIATGIDNDVYSDGYLEVLSGDKDLEEYIRETEKKLKIYFGE